MIHHYVTAFRLGLRSDGAAVRGGARVDDCNAPEQKRSKFKRCGCLVFLGESIYTRKVRSKCGKQIGRRLNAHFQLTA